MHAVLLHGLSVHSYPVMPSKHTPTAQGVAAGQRLSKLKLQLLGGMLKLTGQHKQLQVLQAGCKAFNQQNSLAFNRSMVCSVDHVRALHSQMPPKEQGLLKVVFEESKVMGVQQYCYTLLAGVRQLLMGAGGSVRKVQHSFASKQAFGHEDARAVRTAAAAAVAPRSPSKGPSLHVGRKAAAVGKSSSVLQVQSSTGSAAESNAP